MNKRRNLKKRQSAFRFGKWAETIATAYLTLTRHRIVNRNMRNSCGEIDIIARRKNTLIFIEVKARRNFDDALSAISPRQRRRIERTANLYCAQNPTFSEFDLRFDLIIVLPWRLPKQIKDAWRP